MRTLVFNKTSQVLKTCEVCVIFIFNARIYNHVSYVNPV